MSIKDKYSVESIKSFETYDWLLNKHYKKKLTSISYAFGLFKNNVLVGICTYGSALPIGILVGICGEKYKNIVYELNRLCIENKDKNCLSYFVSQTLKMLPKPKIIVSYSDIEQGHNGYIYQATNFIYTGFSHTQKDWKLKGKEDIHSRTLMDEFSYQKNRINKLKKKYGDNLYQVDRKPKNRYIYFIGSKTQKKIMLNNLQYSINPYP